MSEQVGFKVRPFYEIIKEDFDTIKEKYPQLTNGEVFKIIEISYLRQISKGVNK